MGGLIPLQLRSSSSERTPPIPLRSTKKQHHPSPFTELAIFPCTQEESAKVMDEMKFLYMNRQYKQCSARCIQILENIGDPVAVSKANTLTSTHRREYSVHSLHAIYLSFYVASSLELKARSLHINSSNKLPLLQQSLHYYKNAESSMESAVFSTESTIFEATHQRPPSISSSIRSSVDSVFTRTGSGSSSTLPSPTTSVCDPNSDNEQSHIYSHRSRANTFPGHFRPKKDASFTAHSPTAILEASDLIDAFPNPPTSTIPTAEQRTNATISDHLFSRSLARYHARLSGFQIQLAYHIGSINSQIHTLQACRRARRSNLPNLFTADYGCGGMDGIDKEELKRAELKARIGRVR
jgi:hypothetical protein